MIRNLFAAAVVAVLGGGLVAADLKSGPQTGEKVPGAFHPYNVTGEDAGKAACLYCKGGDDPVAVANHICARKTAFVLQCAVFQPIIQGWLTAVEIRQIVIGRQWNRRRKPLTASRRIRHRSHAGVRRNSARSFGPGCGGLSSACKKAL